MKKILIVLSCLVMMNAAALAGEGAGYRVSLGYGQSKDDIDIMRAGLQKDYGVRWFESAFGCVTGYFELSLNHWDGSGDETTGVALSPVFQYVFNPDGDSFYPYIEGGVGVSYIDEYLIGDRDLSSNFQFEDRIGLGFRYDRLDINFRYMHYSNGGLAKPNDGIDIWMGSLAWAF